MMTCFVTTFAVVWIEIVGIINNMFFVTSPPSRWCGLKCGKRRGRCAWILSPPSRWCGLKSKADVRHHRSGQSPPSRWCGLKFDKIEPFKDIPQSPPSRWCGLKLFAAWFLYTQTYVTTFAVVWIEIYY